MQATDAAATKENDRFRRPPAVNTQTQQHNEGGRQYTGKARLPPTEKRDSVFWTLSTSCAFNRKSLRDRGGVASAGSHQMRGSERHASQQHEQKPC